MSWHKIVSYGMDVDLEVLKSYNNFRKHTVDYILDSIIKNLRCDSCTYHSVGSVTYTSDYDVSVFGENKEDVVKMFNETFVKLFGGESGEVFDTNIYGVTSLIPVSTSRLKRGSPYSLIKSCSKKSCKSFKYIKIPKGVTVDISNQRSWAFVKLFRYLNSTEIKNFISTSNKLKITLLNSDLENSMERYRQSQKEAGDTSLSIMNKKYNQMLIKVKQARLRMKDHPNNLLYKINYKDAESHANYFSSESYYTQGAYIHSVGLLQMKISNLEVTNNELIDSCIENTGDLIKELNNLQQKIKTKEDQLHVGEYMKRSQARMTYEDKKFVADIIKISKYWMRILDAVYRIQTTNPNFTVNSYDKSVIKKAKDDAEHIRQNMRGKKLIDSCKTANNSSTKCLDLEIATDKVKQLLSMFSINKYNLKDVRQQVVHFLLQVLEAHYKTTHIGSTQGGGVDTRSQYYHKYMKYKRKYLQMKSKKIDNLTV